MIFETDAICFKCFFVAREESTFRPLIWNNKYNFKSIYNFKISILGRKLYKFLNKKWFFDKIYNEYINQFLLNFSYFITYKIIDRGLIEMIGPYGLSKTVYDNSKILRKYQSGLTFQYILIFVLYEELNVHLETLF